MTLTVEQFSRQLFKLPDRIVDSRQVEKTSWIIPALICDMRYTNAASYLSRDITTDLVKRSHQKKNNVSFVQMLSPENRSTLKLFYLIAIEALKNIYRGVELYASYGRQYIFPNNRSSTEVNKVYSSERAQSRNLQIGFIILRIERRGAL